MLSFFYSKYLKIWLLKIWKMQALVCIFNGRKKNQTGKAYYFHEGEHLVKFK